MISAAEQAFPNVEIEIKSPDDLVRVLRALRDAIAQRTLVQIRPAGTPFALDDIHVVTDTAPWPDYFEAYFESPTKGARYKLAVETYHGAGGKWERC